MSAWEMDATRDNMTADRLTSLQAEKLNFFNSSSFPHLPQESPQRAITRSLSLISITPQLFGQSEQRSSRVESCCQQPTIP